MERKLPPEPQRIGFLPPVPRVTLVILIFFILIFNFLLFRRYFTVGRAPGRATGVGRLLDRTSRAILASMSYRSLVTSQQRIPLAVRQSPNRFSPSRKFIECPVAGEMHFRKTCPTC